MNLLTTQRSTEQCLASSKILTPTPSSPSECVLPPHQRRGGGSHSPGGEGVGGQYFGRRRTFDWPDLIYSIISLRLTRSNEHNDSAPVVNSASVQHHLRGQSRPGRGVRLTRSAPTDERWVHRAHILVEMKQGQCICPLSWSVHCNFTGDGNSSERG